MRSPCQGPNPSFIAGEFGNEAICNMGGNTQMPHQGSQKILAGGLHGAFHQSAKYG
jgi:hypothetical protein